jgi:hypothetical protein
VTGERREDVVPADLAVGDETDAGGLLLADHLARELVLGPGQVVRGGVAALDRVKRLADYERPALRGRLRVGPDHSGLDRHSQRLLVK